MSLEDFGKQQLSDPEHPLFPIVEDQFDDWSITPGVAAYMWRQLQLRKPQQIVDMGSGLSTVIAAAYAAQTEGARVLSIDHDPQYAARTSQRLESLQLSHVVDLHVSPLVCHGETQGYSLTDALKPLILRAKFDFVFVDGPPSYLAHRRHSLPLVATNIGPEAILMLDDWYRDDEQKTWVEWRKRYKEIRDCQLVASERGLMVGYWRRDVA
jgi:predicted O-methyltransferase YrrM